MTYWSACGAGTQGWALSLAPSLYLGLGSSGSIPRDFSPSSMDPGHFEGRPFLMRLQSTEAGAALGFPKPPLSLVSLPTFFISSPSPLPSGALTPASAPVCPLQRCQACLARVRPFPANPQGLTATSSHFGNLCPSLGDTRGLSRALKHLCVPDAVSVILHHTVR